MKLFSLEGTYDCDHSIVAKLEADKRIENDMEKKVRDLTGRTTGRLYTLHLNFTYYRTTEFYELFRPSSNTN